MELIASMMREGVWVRGFTAGELAKEWGVGKSAVENLSSEAWRRVCAEADDAAKAKPTIAGTLAVSLQQAASAREYRSVASLADVYSKVVGARAPERHEHAHVVAQFEQLAPAAKAKWLRDKARTLLEEAERLEADVAIDVAPRG